MKHLVFVFFFQAKALVLLLVASYSAIEAHDSARQAETEEIRIINVGKWKNFMTLSVK